MCPASRLTFQRQAGFFLPSSLCCDKMDYRGGGAVLLTIDFRCKSCKQLTSVNFLVDDDGTVQRMSNRCQNCGHCITQQDDERFHHLADVLMTANERNRFGQISRIAIFPE